jgi:hypothetical protein
MKVLRTIAILLWVSGVAVVAAPDTWRAWRLAHAGRSTTGTVIGLEPDQHQQVHYSYAAGGRRYVDTDNGCQVRNGLVTVWYVSDSPADSKCDSPGNWRIGLGIGVFAAITGIAFIWAAFAARIPR